jgi:hypothetical protein
MALTTLVEKWPRTTWRLKKNYPLAFAGATYNNGTMALQLDPFVYVFLAPDVGEILTMFPVYENGITKATRQRRSFNRTERRNVDAHMERRIDRVHLKCLMPHARKLSKRV